MIAVSRLVLGVLMWLAFAPVALALLGRADALRWTARRIRRRPVRLPAVGVGTND
jgi:hypothetical protein